MRNTGFLLLGICWIGSGAQELPRQAEVLRAMRLANGYFMGKLPDAGAAISNEGSPSHVWNRAVYYEGLMALYSIDPDKKYYDYALEWGKRHHWTLLNDMENQLADDQCAGQTWIDLYTIDPQPERIRGIKENIDRMVHINRADDWYWIDALQMAMPVFTRLGFIEKDTSYFRKMYDLYH